MLTEDQPKKIAKESFLKREEMLKDGNLEHQVGRKKNK